MTTPAPAALLAFLRGLERRARTLALAQCGDPDRAEQVWRDTAAAFPEEAAAHPVAQWPVRFWARLLAHPALAVANADGSPLAAVGPGPRAALLLRLVAGLDPRPAADVLGVGEPTYRYALQRGLEQARAAGIDADGLRALREAWQRQPPPASPAPKVFAVAPAPEARGPDVAVDAAEAPAPTVDPAPAPSALPPRRWRIALLAVGAAAAIGALSFAWWSGRPLPEPPRPVATAPAPVLAPTAPSPVTHQDYLLVAQPEDVQLAADLELLSWLAAGGDTAAPAPAAAEGGAP